MKAFDVRFLCVQASLLLMRRPPSLLWPCKAMEQPHSGTASTDCTEAANYRSLAPDWEQRPTSSPCLMAPRGHRTAPTHMFGQSLMGNSFVDPITQKLWDVMLSPSTEWNANISNLCSQRSLCCDSCIILFGSSLRKFLQTYPDRGHPNFNFTWCLLKKKKKKKPTQQGWKYQQHNLINMLHSLLTSHRHYFFTYSAAFT